MEKEKMKITIHATRTGKILKGSLDDAPDVLQGSNIYSFELDIGDGKLTPVADCQHEHAFGTFVRPGDVMPQRACPLMPRSNVVESDESMPSDLYETVLVTICPSCDRAGDITIGTEQDRLRIAKAFQKVLEKEDFTDFPELGDEDRNWKRWKIMWDRVEVNGRN